MHNVKRGIWLNYCILYSYDVVVAVFDQLPGAAEHGLQVRVFIEILLIKPEAIKQTFKQTVLKLKRKKADIKKK